MLMVTPRVHILGLGSIGTFAAHAFAEALPRPALTLLLHRQDLFNQYRENGSCISLRADGAETSHQSNYDFEILRAGKWYHAAEVSCLPFTEPTNQGSGSHREADETISQLVVTVKNWQTVAALAPLKHRLGPLSTIMFLQNGSGMIDAVNKEIFPDTTTRPRYVIGITTHCINLLSPFSIEHAAAGKTSFGVAPCEQDKHEGADPDHRNREHVQGGDDVTYMVNALTSVPRMNATAYSFTDLFQLQLEKLAINAVNNPTCALADAKNEYLWQVPDLIRDLLKEVSEVARRLPELRGVPGVEERFSAARLEEVVLNNLRATAAGTCSMVWDLRAKRKTEVRFINGCWVRRGQELGIPTPANAKLVHQIEEREAVYAR